MSELRKIGLMGGTFDPVHYGHLYTAKEIKQFMRFDELRLIPNATPAHRNEPRANSEQRLTMLRLALGEFPELMIDSRELKRKGPSYTFDTLSEIHHQEPGAMLFFIMGIDAFNGFTAWHNWRHILELVHLVVMYRPGYEIKSDVNELLSSRYLQNKNELYNQPAGSIFFKEVTQYDISATKIRHDFKDDSSVRSYLPKQVAQWVEQQSIY